MLGMTVKSRGQKGQKPTINVAGQIVFADIHMCWWLSYVR